MTKILGAMFCDDVRIENNGKVILIGLYTGHMTVPQFPYSGRIFSLLILDEPLPLVCTLRVRVKGGSGAVFAEGEFEIETEAVTPVAQTLLYPMPPAIVSLSSPDTIELWVKIGDAEEVRAGALPVVKVEASHSAA
ncbi:MAG: hypothetical protein LPK04_08695 [Caulobacteraceae bacterium]|nr:hypothetical protein [Caulobacteraceae bacterium]